MFLLLVVRSNIIDDYLEYADKFENFGYVSNFTVKLIIDLIIFIIALIGLKIKELARNFC